MAFKMNPEVKAIWVADLRSGQHEQGITFLNCKGKWCCLGRLVDLYIKSPANTSGIQWVEEGSDSACNILDNRKLLPKIVQTWAGLDCEHGSNVWFEGHYRTLIWLNDNEVPFSKIADLIEAQL